MKKLLLCGIIPLTLALLSLGCSGQECADCGPCGFAGPPSGSTGLQTTNVGKTADGSPAVNMLYWSGTTDDCQAEDTTGLVYDLDSASVSQQADPVELMSGTDRVGEDGTHTWPQDDLELSLEPIDDRSLSLIFSHGEQMVFLDCVVGDDDTIDCS